MAQSFTAQIDAWVRKTEARMNAVVKGSTQDVVEIAQTPVAKGGRMPVVTNFLRGSLQSSLNGSTSLTGEESYVLLAAQMEAGDVAQFGWTAAYARRVNSGFTGPDKLGRVYNQRGRFFVEGAAEQWPAIVADNVRRAKATVSG